MKHWVLVYSCDFNRSMQHLASIQRKEGVADEEVP